MNRYNNYMNSHFAGCRILAYARDLVRGRAVTLFVIPGDFDVIGVSDGTDSWMAPSSAETCFGIPIRQMYRDLQSGIDLPKPVPLVQRQRVALRITDDDESVGLTLPKRSPTRVRIKD